MKRAPVSFLRALGSIRLALLGMVLLGVGAALSYDNPAGTPVWVLVAPLALLAINLFCAIATNPRINRRPGLLVFHLGLFAIIVLAGIGRLTHLDAQLEITEGSAFSPEELTEVKKGPFHGDGLSKVAFIQGSYTVEYNAGMVRGLTHSQVLIPDGRGGMISRVVGDDRPLVLEGYRFYTTYNKGFAPVLTWMPDQGEAMTGTIHMPSYPLFDYKQDSNWTPPGGKPLRFWLRLDTGLRQDAAWLLDGKKASGVLVVNAGERRVELLPGQSLRLEGGSLRYERLTSWMGYKVFYDPTLRWLFIAAVVSIMGLGAHFWRKFGVRMQRTHESSVTETPVASSGRMP